MYFLSQSVYRERLPNRTAAQQESDLFITSTAGASICAVPLNKPFPVKNCFKNRLSRENTLFHDSDKFPRTLSTIVVKRSSEHKKSTGK